MDKIKIGIVGYGNIGRGVEQAMLYLQEEILLRYLSRQKELL